MVSKSLDTLLVTTDFSPSAERGVEWAAALARERGARLVLLTVSEIHLRATEYGYVSVEFDAALLRRTAQERLDHRVARLKDDGVAAECRLLSGFVVETILEQAHIERADLVVIGSRGLSGVKHWVLGSTAEGLVQRSSAPVLTVHSDHPSPRGSQIILAPTDFSQESRLALERGLALWVRDPAQTEIVLLHAPHVPFEYLAFTADLPPVRLYQDVLERVRIALEDQAAGLRAPQVIVDDARERRADAIIMGTHGRSGVQRLLLGSVARRVVQFAPCPVLTLRRGS